MDPPTYPFEETSFMNDPLWKSAIFHSIKLPFDVQASEKILNVI